MRHIIRADHPGSSRITSSPAHPRRARTAAPGFSGSPAGVWRPERQIGCTGRGTCLSCGNSIKLAGVRVLLEEDPGIPRSDPRPDPRSSDRMAEESELDRLRQAFDTVIWKVEMPRSRSDPGGWSPARTAPSSAPSAPCATRSASRSPARAGCPEHLPVRHMSGMPP
jgi:hypothetical protein